MPAEKRGMAEAVQAFDEQAVSGRSRLDQVATLLTSEAMCPDPEEMFVIALRPDRDDRRVIASAGNSAVRASVSVSIAAGNQRAWAQASSGEIVDIAIPSLPEVIRASIQPSGLQSVRVAAVTHGDTNDCLLMWLARSATVSPEAHARHAIALQNLTDAAARDREVAAERAAEELARQAAQPTEPVGHDADGADVLATLPNRRDFDAALADVRSDETGLIVLGIDNLEQIVGELGADAADQVRAAVAARLSRACRRNDVIAWIGDNAFAVLLVDVDRRAAFEISKRLRSDVSAPVELGSGTPEISISVGLSHEVGLVDPAELFASAESAMEDAQEAGGARMLVAC
jgi:diguanylate cyclase (GGDEF)-like protein